MQSKAIVKIAVGIQARSTSKRLPRKVHMVLTNKTILEHVVTASRDAAIYLNRLPNRRVSVYLLIPQDDEILFRRPEIEVPIIEGPEDDVLTRYLMLAAKTKADYFCRITADCPLIPPFVISKMITIACMNNYDYVSNVDDRCRTAPDGIDCEVISLRLLQYLGDNAKGEDREHVTTLARREPPEWIRHGTVVNHQDASNLKLSVDTLEDLERVRDKVLAVEAKYLEAVKIFGKQSVHRI